MLSLPENGMHRSIKAHNVHLDVFCDWIEASLLFSDNYISKASIKDILLEDELYVCPDFAYERIEEAWSILEERYKTVGQVLDVKMGRDYIELNGSWQKYSPYAFFMALTCAVLYPSWSKTWISKQAHIHGDLFEQLSTFSVESMFCGWKVERVGWAPTSKLKMCDYIDDLISRINEKDGAEKLDFVSKHANDLGLDLLAYYPFSDAYNACPIIMLQCACGKNWEGKKNEPCLDEWSKIISFQTPPMKGMAIPYAFTSRTEFRVQTASVKGLFLDRYRLLQPMFKSAIPPRLDKEVTDWVTSKISTLEEGNC